MGHLDFEESLHAFPLQGRQARREGDHQLGRQQGRAQNRRSSDRRLGAPRRETMASHRLPALLLVAMLPCVCSAQQDAQKEVERYRQLLAEGNPADLFEARGEDLWKTSRGPKKASLEQCDLGLGAGVVKGAYARLPRYFADTDR